MAREHKPPRLFNDPPPDMKSPHEKFQFWRREVLYDQVTGMYMDSWDNAEVAEVLGEQVGFTVIPDLIEDVRREAAVAADAQDSQDVRLKWVYRYRDLTVNNLVKEHMFLAQEPDFLQSKRALANEISALIKETPQDSLWIGVNDAVGRNNVGPEIIQALAAYHLTVLKVEAMLKPYAEARDKTVAAAAKDVAARIGDFSEREGKGNEVAIRAFTASVLKWNEKAIGDDVIGYLIEYHRFASKLAAPGRRLDEMIAYGADISTGPLSLLEMILAGRDCRISSGDVASLAKSMRSNPVMAVEKLDKILDFVTRHIKGLELRKELTQSTTPERMEKLESLALEALRSTVAGQREVADARSFYSEKELAAAKARGAKEPELQEPLGILNQLTSLDAVVARIKDNPLAGWAVAFPSGRYCMKRFGTPGPFARS